MPFYNTGTLNFTIQLMNASLTAVNHYYTIQLTTLHECDLQSNIIDHIGLNLWIFLFWDFGYDTCNTIIDYSDKMSLFVCYQKAM